MHVFEPCNYGQFHETQHDKRVGQGYELNKDINFNLERVTLTKLLLPHKRP